MKTVSIRKAKKILRKIAATYRRRKKKLSRQVQNEFENLFKEIRNSIRARNKPQCSESMHKLMKHADHYLRLPYFLRLLKTVGDTCIALIIAIIIRQVWFEFYNIPSGSMRPTFKEGKYCYI